MSIEPDTADQQGPRETKPATRTVRVLTSWKLWTVLLVLGLIGIGVSLTMPIVHRLRALAYFDRHKDIEYELSREHEDWPEKYGEWTNALREVDAVWAMAATDETLLHAAALHEAKRVELVESETHPITRRGAASLRPFERLQELELMGQGFSDEAIADMLERRPPLQFVTLLDTGATRQSLTAISELPSIAELKLFTRALRDDDFQNLAPLPNLQGISLTGGGDECAEWLANSPELTVAELYLSTITDEGMRSLRQCRKIEWLCIQGGMLTDEGLQHLKGVPSLHHLTLIDCSNLTADGIARLPYLPELESLTFSTELMTTESIAKLKDLPRLHVLNGIGSTLLTPQLRAQLHEKWIFQEIPIPTDVDFWESICPE